MKKWFNFVWPLHYSQEKKSLQKIVQSYFEKKLFYWWRKTFEFEAEGLEFAINNLSLVSK